MLYEKKCIQKKDFVEVQARAVYDGARELWTGQNALMAGFLVLSTEKDNGFHCD